MIAKISSGILQRAVVSPYGVLINIRTGEIGITLPTLPYDTTLVDRVNLLIFLELAGVRLHTYTATNHQKPLSLVYVGIHSSKLSSFSLSLSYLVLSERKLVFYYLPGPTRFKPMWTQFLPWCRRYVCMYQIVNSLVNLQRKSSTLREKKLRNFIIWENSHKTLGCKLH